MTEENEHEPNTVDQAETDEADQHIESIASGEEPMDLKAKVGPAGPSLLDRCRKLLGMQPKQ